MTRGDDDLGWPGRVPYRPLRLQPRTVLATIAYAQVVLIRIAAAVALWWAL